MMLASSIFSCSYIGRVDKIMTLNFISGGKRSAEMYGDNIENDTPTQKTSFPEPEPLKEKPIPFDMNLHGHRYRRTSHCDHQYVLFLLDTSGSIGETDFCRMNCLLSDLVQWFCHPISVAAMTFSHTFHKEFCFDSFDNTCAGRNGAKSAIRNLAYRGGGLTLVTPSTVHLLRCSWREIVGFRGIGTVSILFL